MDAQGPLVSCYDPQTRKDTLDGPKYRQILDEELLPHAEAVYGEDRGAWTFMQDGAPCHRSATVREWFAQTGVQVMEWPAQSPDLNPIESMWFQIKRAIGRRNFETKQALWEAVAEEWNKVTMEQRIKLVESMPKRCLEVIRANGMATKY